MRVQGKRINAQVGPDFSGPTCALIPDAEDVGGTGGVVLVNCAKSGSGTTLVKDELI